MRKSIRAEIEFQRNKLLLIARGELPRQRNIDPIPKDLWRRALARYPLMVMWKCSICDVDEPCAHREPELLRFFIGLPPNEQRALITKVEEGE